MQHQIISKVYPPLTLHIHIFSADENNQQHVGKAQQEEIWKAQMQSRIIIALHINIKYLWGKF